MKKKPEQNKEIIRQSIISGMQQAHSAYKKYLKLDIDRWCIMSDGDFGCLDDGGEYQRQVKYWLGELKRLRKQLDEL